MHCIFRLLGLILEGSNRSEPLKAAFWMVGAMISFTLMAVAGRSLASELDTFEIMMYRSFIGILLVLTFSFYFKTITEVNLLKIRLHFFRNLMHFIGQNLWFYAVIFVPLSQMFAFEFSTPVWVALMAPFFLSERLTLVRISAAFTGFVGILIVARPDLSEISLPIIAAALCAIFFASTSVATKLLTREQTVTGILFWLVFIQAIFGIVTAGFDGDIAYPSSANLPWVILVGICGLAAHLSITKALTLAPAIIVMPLEFLRLPLISIVGFFLYNEGFEWQVWLGALIILMANAINIRSEMTSK